MPKFTTIENLINQSYQSIAGEPPTDNRVELGTKTLDNRDFWENINFNEDTFQPYLTGNLQTLNTEVRDGIVYRTNIETSVRYQYSVDALPFVTDPNNDDEIIRLDQYYDKKNNSTEYYLATEGKINYYLYARESGRPTPDGHIDNYIGRNAINRFDSYAQQSGSTGHYLFKLNWGDGTEIEYTDEIGGLKEPKLLEGSTLLEHTYEKPGFYTISGVVFALFKPDDGTDRESIGGYERFETNILLNPSKTYEFDLYDYDNFATIGGISLDSTLIKSSLNTIGINPINPLDDQRASSENIEKLNLQDKLQLFNFLNKVSGSFLNEFEDLLEFYSVEFDSTPKVPLSYLTAIKGCMNPNADNYNSEAVEDDGSCQFSFEVKLTATQFLGLAQSNVVSGNNPTISYENLTDNNNITLTAFNQASNDEQGFTGWEIISGENFEDGTIELTNATSQETQLIVTKEADLNNYGTIRVKANFTYTVTPNGSVNLEIYSSNDNWGSVNLTDAILTVDDQSLDLVAIAEDDNNNFNYSFEKWEIVNGQDYVGFGANKTSETVTPTPTLNWDNEGNPNQTARVRAVFSREQVTTGTGGTTGGTTGGKRPGGAGGIDVDSGDDLVDPTGEGF